MVEYINITDIAHLYPPYPIPLQKVEFDCLYFRQI